MSLPLNEVAAASDALLVFCCFPDDASSRLAEILARFRLRRRLLWADVCALFQLVRLALCSVGFCALLCHADSFPQVGFWRYPWCKTALAHGLVAVGLG